MTVRSLDAIVADYLAGDLVPVILERHDIDEDTLYRLLVAARARPPYRR